MKKDKIAEELKDLDEWIDDLYGQMENTITNLEKMEKDFNGRLDHLEKHIDQLLGR